MEQNKNMPPPPAKMSTSTAVVTTVLSGFSLLLMFDPDQAIVGVLCFFASLGVGHFMEKGDPVRPQNSNNMDLFASDFSVDPNDEFFGVGNIGRFGTDDLSGES